MTAVAPAVSSAAGAGSSAFDELPRLLEAKQRSTQHLRLASVAALHELQLEATYKIKQAAALQRKRAARMEDNYSSRALRPLLLRLDALQIAQHRAEEQRSKFDDANAVKGWPDLVKACTELPGTIDELSATLNANLAKFESALLGAGDGADVAADVAAWAQKEADSLKARKQAALQELDRLRKRSSEGPGASQQRLVAQQQKAADVERLKEARAKLAKRVAVLEQTLGLGAGGPSR